MIEHDTSDPRQPRCAKCGKIMTPQDSRTCPEFFYHNACIPDALRIELEDAWMTQGPQHAEFLLWKAINEYAEACGGDTSDRTICERRMNAVVQVGQAIHNMMNKP